MADFASCLIGGNALCKVGINLRGRSSLKEVWLRGVLLRRRDKRLWPIRHTLGQKDYPVEKVVHGHSESLEEP
jgi:hypothetical protein